MKTTLKTIALIAIGVAVGRMSRNKNNEEIQSYTIPVTEGKPSRIGYSSILVNGKTGTGLIMTAKDIRAFSLVRN